MNGLLCIKYGAVDKIDGNNCLFSEVREGLRGVKKMSGFYASEFINKFESIYNIYITIVIVLAGLFLIFYDERRNVIRGLQREAKICHFLGLFYIVAAVSLYIVSLVV